MSASYKFFQHKECEYFPCHKDGKLNCLFCFCPLYHMTDCGGTYTHTEKGIRDCSRCSVPHEDYDYVVRKLKGEHEEKARGKP